MGAKPKLLIIEDEAAILEGLIDLFTYHGYDVDTATDGQAGLEKALTLSHHLVILDLMLPKMDGFEVCNRIRESDRALPIIILTAKSSDEDIVKGLSLGADDYITKPFSVREVVARVEAVLRRSGKWSHEAIEIRVGELRVDVKTLEGKRGSQIIPFTRREIHMLQYLTAHADRPVSRTELLREVWGYANASLMETRTVDIHVTKLRRKIEKDASNPTYLVTVRGEGYRLLTGE